MDEQEYSLSPKGMAYAVMTNMGMLNPADRFVYQKATAFWDQFSKIMCNTYGYKNKEELWNTVKNGGRKTEEDE